ncbi:unnamed protein product, partial [Fusarium graminearum]
PNGRLRCLPTNTDSFQAAVAALPPGPSPPKRSFPPNLILHLPLLLAQPPHPEFSSSFNTSRTLCLSTSTLSSKPQITANMDVLDGSSDKKIVEWIKELEKNAAKAKKRKGQLVKDHQPQSNITTQFMAKLLGKCIITPSSTPGAGFVEMILGTAHPLPNSKVLDEFAKSIPPTTHVIEPYSPCTIAEKDLEPISIYEMQLDTHHRGRKVLLHILTPPDRNEAVLTIAEDEQGTAVLLRLFQQPDEKQFPCTATMVDHTVCIVKDPFFQQSFDSDRNGPVMLKSAYYSLRVDHPSDIIPLLRGDERIPEKWRSEVRGNDKSSSSSREEGNKSFRKKQWAEAHFSQVTLSRTLVHASLANIIHGRYSQAIAKADTPEDKQLAHLNRSLTNLKIGRPAKAFSDATQAYDPNTPSEKALFRHVNALYALQKFEQCEATIQTLLDAFPGSKVAEATMQRVKSRLLEQRMGKYKFKLMYEQAKAKDGPPLIDCATFSRPVEIRDSPGRGRGLFTTKSVSAGDLLLVEKAFSYSYMDENRLWDQITYMINLTTKRATAGASANLWPQVVQKLYHDSDSLSAFQDLVDGEYQRVTVSECDGASVVDSFLVEKIISLNSFGSPTTTRDFCKNIIWSGKVGPSPSCRERPLFTTAGVWLLAARINHSCVGNCRRSFIGDIQIVRAARDIPAGTELTFPYCPTGDSETYQDVQNKLAKWGFTCDCELCKDRRKTTEAVRVLRKELHDDFMDQSPSDEPFDLDKAMKLLKGIEKTYRGKPAKQVRWVLASIYAYIGIRCRQDGEFVEAAEMLIKAIEAMGFVIQATPPGGARGPSHFEVKHWGMMEHHVPWLFFQLIECYDEIDPQLVPVAEHYARVAYSIIVGEHESMWDVLPSTGSEGRVD